MPSIAARVLQHDLARGGAGGAIRAPAGPAQFVFQRADRLGYGGLGGKQHARRLGKAALPHHFDKHPEIAQLHCTCLPIP
jgi:hypothetical protein